MEKQVGVLNEQGYFGTGFGFTEATEEEKQKLREQESDDSNKRK